MTPYDSILKKVFTLALHGGIKLGLSNSERLSRLTGVPHKNFKAIHIAGTNGKGSTAIKMAKALTLQGYRVGLFTSPHLSCIRERIRLNGEMITEEAFTSLLTSLFALQEKEKIAATFFEMMTAAAFLYFSDQKADFVVVETGLGGRLDATNIITPSLSVITSISFDHQEILGSTLEAITREKAGIIKPGVPVVIGPQVPFEVIQSCAKERGSELILVSEKDPSSDRQNSLIAATALRKLAKLYPLSEEAIKLGLEAKQPCRFECIGDSPPIILDVGHNPDGLKRLFHEIKSKFPEKKIRILFGLSQNKDLEKCLKALAAHGMHFYCVTAQNGRGHPPAILAKTLKKLTDCPVETFNELEVGFLKAQKETNVNNELLVICGTFFIMSDIRKALKIDEPRDRIDLNERTRL